MSVIIQKTTDNFSKVDTGSNLLSNIEGYWKLDESSGDAVDSSGNGMSTSIYIIT